MTVVVYPQLGELLQARRLTVADLERQLRRRFGLTVNTKTLYRLTKPEPIQRADLEVALATAAILEVALDDLFTMRTLPDDGDEIAPVLDPVASRRLAELFDRQATRPLTADERDELERLVLDYSRRARDRELRRYADERGLSIEQARDQGARAGRRHRRARARGLPRRCRFYPGAMSGLGDSWLAALSPDGPHSRRDPAVRRGVRLRARLACEYCPMPDDGDFEVEHIIPPRRWPAYAAGRLPRVPARPGRRGPDHVDNYAWSCPRCNAHKLERVQGQAAGDWRRLFDPRHDAWPDHFRFSPSGLLIIPLMPIGAATRAVLKLNGTEADPYVLELRALLIRHGSYPPTWAAPWRV